ncbi:MAG: cobyric acid synthase [Bryobacteraceae bacterium]
MARSIFVGGTGSHVGKSWTTTAICRYLRRRGFRVAPFKAQNMSNNSFPCRNGGEIGRAQVAQAEACGLEPESDMNPVLLKPNSSTGCQVVLDGKVWRNFAAREYYEHFDFLLEHVLAAYERLAARYDYVVIEGAGSVVEMNLKDRDLVNMGLARRLNAPALLVADIDRGGVFAAIVGTFCLLDSEERRLTRAFAINRFRGDLSLFGDGVRMLEERSGVPCLGVFPMQEDLSLDPEDGVSLEENPSRIPAEARVAIVRFPRISNFTDFRLLPSPAWISRPVNQVFDLVILPGTKNTIGDLAWMRKVGLDEWVLRQHREGATVLGVCGGYQMLGARIDDPEAVESHDAAAEGLGLLPVETVLAADKITRVVDACTHGGARFSAYEIHMGRTTRPDGAVPFATLGDGGEDGMRAERCIGTYLHGALENRAVLEELLGCPIAEPAPKERTYDGLADWFEQHADLRAFEELYL